MPQPEQYACTFTNHSTKHVVIGLFGMEHGFRTDSLAPGDSETTDNNHLIVASDRVAVAFHASDGAVLAEKSSGIINCKTGVILEESDEGEFELEFVCIVDD